MSRNVTVPLREQSGPESSESLMISALLESGVFNPYKYGLTIEDCDSWQKLWQFCEKYQDETATAPPMALVKQKFPDFEIIPGVAPAYAAKQLASDSEARKLKLSLRAALRCLEQEDVEAARAELATVYGARPLGKAGDSLWHEPEYEDSIKYPVPYDALGRTTGGIGRGELWYFCANSGHGKTMMLCYYLRDLLKMGLKIDYLSLEVPTRTINKRVRRAMATKDELKLLDATKEDSRGNKVPDRDKIMQAIEMQRGRIDGQLHVYDPSHGRVTPATVRHHMENSDLVVVDHIGLMYTPDGRRAVDDWRAQAVISNCLMEDKLATDTPLLAAAQLNKTGEEGNGTKPPRVTSVGGAYQLVQDADVVVTHRRMSTRTMVHGNEKTREGATALWYSMFDVAKADYRQITWEQAQSVMSEDEDQYNLR